eukprot:TRINITY_DN38164_c0_g1_i1.p1 TRINITY_DN38164_c0_g1~~TRINITY_DN38164_c0_g1_i1.p1  ORF type:complete len:617 (+),score=80.08 TRINITY_DN38164_c0_g1_i1:61-1911(+)
MPTDVNIGGSSTCARHGHLLIRAAHKGKVDTLRSLLPLASSEQKDPESEINIALRRAALYAHADCVRLLLDKRAVVNAVCSGERRSALHEACVFSSSAEVVSLLLSRAADVTLTAKLHGQMLTAQQMAERKGCNDIAQLIESAGTLDRIAEGRMDDAAPEQHTSRQEGPGYRSKNSKSARSRSLRRACQHPVSFAAAPSQIEAWKEELAIKDMQLQEARNREAEREAKEAETLLTIATLEKELQAKAEEQAETTQRLLLQLEHLKLELKGSKIITHQGSEWQYEHGNCWFAFPADVSDQVLNNYVSYLSHWQPLPIQICISGVMYEINFQSMTQTNKSTRRQRRIRLNCKVPASWKTPPETLLCQQPSQVWAKEYDWEVWNAVGEMLNKTCHGTSCNHLNSKCPMMQGAIVVNLYRIENLLLWQNYMQFCRRILFESQRNQTAECAVEPSLGINGQDMNGPRAILESTFKLSSGANEVFLFHGTTRAEVEQIVKTGFDHRLSNGNCFYGSGVYFASQSCKSNQYTCCPHFRCQCPGTRFVIVARVALGLPYYTHETCKRMRRPPEVPGKDATFYNSVVANPGPMASHYRNRQDHQEFVIFEQSQAYPAYVVAYTVS